MKKSKGYDMTVRGLTLDAERRKVLYQALDEQASRVEPYARDIYASVKEKLGYAGDKVLLNAAQTSTVKSSLERYEREHGKTRETRLMLCQITMTRKEFQDYVARLR